MSDAPTVIRTLTSNLRNFCGEVDKRTRKLNHVHLPSLFLTKVVFFNNFCLLLLGMERAFDMFDMPDWSISFKLFAVFPICLIQLLIRDHPYYTADIPKFSNTKLMAQSSIPTLSTPKKRISPFPIT